MTFASRRKHVCLLPLPLWPFSLTPWPSFSSEKRLPELPLAGSAWLKAFLSQIRGARRLAPRNHGFRVGRLDWKHSVWSQQRETSTEKQKQWRGNCIQQNSSLKLYTNSPSMLPWKWTIIFQQACPKLSKPTSTLEYTLNHDKGTWECAFCNMIIFRLKTEGLVKQW